MWFCRVRRGKFPSPLLYVYICRTRRHSNPQERSCRRLGLFTIQARTNDYEKERFRDSFSQLKTTCATARTIRQSCFGPLLSIHISGSLERKSRRVLSGRYTTRGKTLSSRIRSNSETRRYCSPPAHLIVAVEGKDCFRVGIAEQ